MALYSHYTKLMENGVEEGLYIDIIKKSDTEPKLTSSIIKLIDFLLDESLAPERGALDLVAYSYLCNMIIADAKKVHPQIDYTNSKVTMALYLNHKQLVVIALNVDINFNADYMFSLVEDDLNLFLDACEHENESPPCEVNEKQEEITETAEK